MRSRRVLLAVLLAGLLPAWVVGEEPADDVSSRVARFMEQAAAEGFTGAVIVARGGEVLFQEGYGLANPEKNIPVSADTIFTTGSITKQFTAAAILKLQERGKLQVSDPMSKYLGKVPRDKRDITIHHLLSHQAGFPGAIGSDRERVGRDEFVRRALGRTLLFKPGTRYEYSNVGYSLAAAIVEIVSGQGYEEFLRQNFFIPAGMTDTGYTLPKWKPERLAHGVDDDGGDWGTLVDRVLSDGGPGWHLLGNGGIQSTVIDMNRWHRALMGSRILSEESKQLMYTRHADEGGGTWYGYGWTVRDSPWGTLVKHNGGNRIFFSDFLRYLDQDVDIYYSTSSRDGRMSRLGFKLAEVVLGEGSAEMEPRRGELIATGEAPPAPAGSAAAKWGFPGSFRGQQAAELLEAITTEDDSGRRRFVETGFAPGVIERNGVEGLLGALQTMRDEMGDLDVKGLQSRGEHGVVIVVATGKQAEPLQVILELETEEPHRIRSIELMVGD